MPELPDPVKVNDVAIILTPGDKADIDLEALNSIPVLPGTEANTTNEIPTNKRRIKEDIPNDGWENYDLDVFFSPTLRTSLIQLKEAGTACVLKFKSTVPGTEFDESYNVTVNNVAAPSGDPESSATSMTVTFAVKSKVVAG